MNVKSKLAECVRPLLLGALFLGTAAHADVQPLNRVVAIVDNDVIMQTQLDARVREVQPVSYTHLTLPTNREV